MSAWSGFSTLAAGEGSRRSYSFMAIGITLAHVVAFSSGAVVGFIVLRRYPLRAGAP